MNEHSSRPTVVARILMGTLGFVVLTLGLFAAWFVHGWTEAFGGDADYTPAFVLLAGGVFLLNLAFRRRDRRRRPVPRRSGLVMPNFEAAPSELAPCSACDRAIDLRRAVCVYCGTRMPHQPIGPPQHCG